MTVNLLLTSASPIIILAICILPITFNWVAMALKPGSPPVVYFNPNLSANFRLITEIAAPESGVAAITFPFIFTTILRAVVPITPMLSSSIFSRASFTCSLYVLLHSKPPTVVFAGAFQISGRISYGLLGGWDKACISIFWIGALYPRAWRYCNCCSFSWGIGFTFWTGTVFFFLHFSVG